MLIRRKVAGQFAFETLQPEKLVDGRKQLEDLKCTFFRESEYFDLPRLHHVFRIDGYVTEPVDGQ